MKMLVVVIALTAFLLFPTTGNAADLNAAQLKGYTQFINGKLPVDGAAACNAACVASHEYWLLKPTTEPQITQHERFVRNTDQVRGKLGAGKLTGVFSRVSLGVTAFYVGWKIGSVGREWWIKDHAPDVVYNGTYQLGGFGDGRTQVDLWTGGPGYVKPLHAFQVHTVSPNAPVLKLTFYPETGPCVENEYLDMLPKVFAEGAAITAACGSVPMAVHVKEHYWAPAKVETAVEDPGELAGDTVITTPDTGEPEDVTSTQVETQLDSDADSEQGLAPVFDPNEDGLTEDGAMGEWNDVGAEGSGDGTEPMTPGGGGAGMCEPWVKPNLNFTPLNQNYGSAFPFGVPIWLWDTAAAWSVTGDAPSFSIDFTVADLEIDFSVLEPVLEVIRPILLIGALVGLVLALSGWALGSPGTAAKE